MQTGEIVAKIKKIVRASAAVTFTCKCGLEIKRGETLDWASGKCVPCAENDIIQQKKRAEELRIEARNARIESRRRRKAKLSTQKPAKRRKTKKGTMSTLSGYRELREAFLDAMAKE